MADCVTAKHTGGVVVVVVVVAVVVEVGCRGKQEGRGGQTERRKTTGLRKTVADGCERRNIAAHIGVGSFSLLRLLSQAAVMQLLTSLIMRHENAL